MKRYLAYLLILIFSIGFFSCTLKFKHDNDDLNFKYSIRKSNDSDSNSTIMLLHGFGGNEKELSKIFSSLSDKSNIVSIRAPRDLGNKYAWFGANFFEGEVVEIDTVAMIYTIMQLDTFIRGYKKLYPEYSKNIILTGYSQGAMMSAMYLSLFPKNISGICCAGGNMAESLLPKPGNKTKNKHCLILHGKNDNVIPIEQGKNMAIELNKRFDKVEFIEFNSEHTLTAEMLEVMINWLNNRVS